MISLTTAAPFYFYPLPFVPVLALTVLFTCGIIIITMKLPITIISKVVTGLFLKRGPDGKALNGQLTKRLYGIIFALLFVILVIFNPESVDQFIELFGDLLEEPTE